MAASIFALIGTELDCGGFVVGFKILMMSTKPGFAFFCSFLDCVILIFLMAVCAFWTAAFAADAAAFAFSAEFVAAVAAMVAFSTRFFSCCNFSSDTLSKAASACELASLSMKAICISVSTMPQVHESLCESQSYRVRRKRWV